MSFIYAEKIPCEYHNNKETINIYCDTKIIHSSTVGATFPDPTERELIGKYGIAKSTIICPEICISFAGNNIDHAGKLFQELKEQHSFELKDVLTIANKIHNSTPDINDIEFIITSFENNKLQIDCVKNGNLYTDCQNAWIGSNIAHKHFQRYRIINNCYNKAAYEKTVQAFWDTIAGCGDDTVGGFPIVVNYNYDLNSFTFANYKFFHNPKEQLVKPGEKVVFYTTAENGGYSFECVPINIFEVLLIFDQVELAIVYSRRLRMSSKTAEDSSLSSFMFPMLLTKNEDGSWKRCR